MMSVNPNIIGKQGYTLPYTPSEDYIQLAVLENRHPPCESVRLALREAAAGLRLGAYPAPHDELIQNIKEYNGLGPDTEVLLTAGSDNALKLICDTFIQSGSRILVPSPTYPHMLHFLECSQAHTPATRLDIDPTAMQDPDKIAEMLSAELQAQHYDVCYIVNPNMPFGYELSVHSLEGMATRFPLCLFVIDEAYQEYGLLSDNSAARLCYLDNVIVTRTFSKAFGLAALRIGYCVANKVNAGLLRILHNQKDVGQLAMQVAHSALQAVDYYKAQANLTQQIKHDFVERFKTLVGDVFTGIHAAAGNFLFIFCRDPAAVAEELLKQRILVRNKHPEIPNGLRICIGTQQDMDSVFSACHRIASMRSAKHYIFDLDGVLRHGARSDDPLDQAMLAYVRKQRELGKRISLVTNNSAQSPDALYDMFEKRSIRFDTIVTPASILIRDVPQDIKRIFVIGTEAACTALSCRFEVLSRDRFAEAQALVLLNDLYGLHANDWARIHFLAARVPWYVSEDNLATTVALSAECDLDPESVLGMSSVLIPDTGVFVDVVRELAGTEPVILGKPHIGRHHMADLDDSVFVGDSFQDHKQSEAWGCTYVDVRELRPTTK